MENLAPIMHISDNISLLKEKASIALEASTCQDLPKCLRDSYALKYKAILKDIQLHEKKRLYIQQHINDEEIPLDPDFILDETLI